MLGNEVVLYLKAPAENSASLGDSIIAGLLYFFVNGSFSWMRIKGRMKSRLMKSKDREV